MTDIRERALYFMRWCDQRHITCTCGGPDEARQQGEDYTGHAPDCALELAWNTAMAAFDDENSYEEPVEDDAVQRYISAAEDGRV